jgi:hypothetical protein
MLATVEADLAAWREVENIAFHEAGHVVAAYLSGIPIVRVSIEGGDDHAGRFTMTQATGNRFRAWLFGHGGRKATDGEIEGYVFTLLAGAEAERIHRAEPGDVAAVVNTRAVTQDAATNWKDSQGALEFVSRMLGKRRIYGVAATWAEACRRSLEARRRLEEPATWQAVTELAEALMMDTSLERGAIRSIVRRELVKAHAAPAREVHHAP